MNKLTIAAQTIKESVSALEVGQVIGLNIDQHGRCSCPFHNGKDRNMKLFGGNRGFSCFVCHETGDCIKLAQQYYKMSFRDTILWFNSTFNLSLDLDGRIDEEQRRQAEMAQRMRKEATEQKELKDRMSFGVMLMADRIVERLEDIRDANAPKTPNERWNDAFCNAIRSLPGAREFVDDCMMDCLKEGK
jgi:DNA primase